MPPLTPPQQRHIMGAGRDLWVKIRASEAERAAWHVAAMCSNAGAGNSSASQ